MERLKQDLTFVNRIAAVNMILKTLQNLTELRISLVSRITKDSWSACAVLDNAGFGINAGDQLDLSTTY